MAIRRVVVTGLGVISAIGRNTAEFWSSLAGGISGIRPMEIVDRNLLRFQNAAEVRDYKTGEYFEPEKAIVYDRFCEFGLIAAREALKCAAIEWTPELCRRAAIVTGTAMGGQTTEDAAFADLYRHGKTRFHPLNIARVMGNALASHLSMETGIIGPVFNLSTACSSSNHAIGHAFWLVRSGIADIAVTGGSEAPLSLGNLKAWEAMRVVAMDTCRPFSQGRGGMILGEGAGILILEEFERARGRGATIYGEIVGFGMSADAHHITQPAADGAAAAMRQALGDGEVPPEAVGYINAHGTGTPSNDPTETAAIRLVFGSHADRLAVSSTKSMHGHTLGAAGALEGVATVLSLRNAVAPPTANYLAPDPECDLDVVPNHSRAFACEYALSNSFAFGGLNAVLAFRK
jgi:nodulation protein E